MKAKMKIIAIVAAFILALPLSANDAMSVNEFSALEIREARSVKIADVLGKENQDALADACRKSDSLIDLDLSGCTFPADEEAEIDLFHIRNVRSCVLPKTTKRIVNFDCNELESVALSDAVLEECGDYWVKLSCFLELSDGTRIPLEGSARLCAIVCVWRGGAIEVKTSAPTGYDRSRDSRTASMTSSTGMFARRRTPANGDFDSGSSTVILKVSPSARFMIAAPSDFTLFKSVARFALASV